MLLYSGLLYFRQFRDLVSVAALRSLHELVTVRLAVIPLLRRGDLLLFVTPVVLLLAALWPQCGRLPRASSRWCFAASLVGLLCIAAPCPRDRRKTARYMGHPRLPTRLD